MSAVHPFSSSFEGKTALITGGAGFIGSHLARALVQAGAKVTVVDSMIETYGGNLRNIKDIRDQIDFNITDVRDNHAMAYLITGKDFLFNLAGQTSHMDSMVDPFTDLDINTRAQLSILESCRQHNPDIRIVFASTRQVYGRPQYLPVDEKHPVTPVDVNGVNKHAGESFYLLYQDVYGIPVTILRLTNTYGPGMRIKDARQTFVGIWIKNIIEGINFEVWGGDQLRDFNYVDDVVQAILLSATNDNARGAIYNLGSNEVISLKKLADLLVEISECTYSVKDFPEERRKIDIGDYYSDYQLIHKDLGWQPETDLRSGLTRTLDYFQANIDAYA